MTASRPHTTPTLACTMTLAQYQALPEDCRIELIEGMPYLLASPSPTHQSCALALATPLHLYLHGKTCRAYIAPLDVFLHEDQRRPTVVQPDVFVVCDKSKIGNNGCHGAPDLVIEILSPSTKAHDILVKLNLYMQASVREYWLVDPEAQILQQFVLDGATYRLQGAYGAQDKVKVAVLDDCTVDLADVFSE